MLKWVFLLSGINLQITQVKQSPYIKFSHETNIEQIS